MRTVVWFSAGSTSAVALKMVASRHRPEDGELVAAYCDTGSEHPDNERFLADVEKWAGVKITRLKSEKFDDIWDVFEKTRYLAGVNGARCTSELKKRVREEFQRVDDRQVFGFDAGEANRARKFREHHTEVDAWFPLLEEGITKADSLKMLEDAGIELPVMYKLGYEHNNCLGCPKGQAGYWNKIRVDFPEVFDRMAKVERKLNAAICKTEPLDRATGKRKRIRVFLDELDPDAGHKQKGAIPSCSFFCEIEKEKW